MTGQIELGRPTVGRLLLAVGVVLLVPLVAMQFTDEVRWEPGDFLAMSVLLLGSGGAWLAMVRWVRPSRRLAVTMLVCLVVLWLWAEMAVGVFTTWGS